MKFNKSIIVYPGPEQWLKHRFFLFAFIILIPLLVINIYSLMNVFMLPEFDVYYLADPLVMRPIAIILISVFFTVWIIRLLRKDKYKKEKLDCFLETNGDKIVWVYYMQEKKKYSKLQAHSIVTHLSDGSSRSFLLPDLSLKTTYIEYIKQTIHHPIIIGYSLDLLNVFSKTPELFNSPENIQKYLPHNMDADKKRVHEHLYVPKL